VVVVVVIVVVVAVPCKQLSQYFGMVLHAKYALEALFIYV